jgi:hypothetical protein
MCRPNPWKYAVLGVAAAEVGFKHFVSRTFPDTAWLLDLPSPPLTEMLNTFPWEQLKLRINDKVPAVPDLMIDELKKAVHLRNKIVHSGVAPLRGGKGETSDILGVDLDPGAIHRPRFAKRKDICLCGEFWFG